MRLDAVERERRERMGRTSGRWRTVEGLGLTVVLAALQV